MKKILTGLFLTFASTYTLAGSGGVILKDENNVYSIEEEKIDDILDDGVILFEFETNNDEFFVFRFNSGQIITIKIL